MNLHTSCETGQSRSSEATMVNQGRWISNRIGFSLQGRKCLSGIHPKMQTVLYIYHMGNKYSAGWANVKASVGNGMSCLSGVIFDLEFFCCVKLALRKH